MTQIKGMLRALGFCAAVVAAGCGGSSSTAVTGTVLDRYRMPLEGARVSIGKEPVATTDAWGHFRVSSAAKSYDVAVTFDEPTVQSGLPVPPTVSRALVVKGLSRRDPTLYLPSAHTKFGGGLNHITSVQGVSETGASTANPPFLWGFVGAGGEISGQFSTGSFAWHGPAPMEGKLAVLVEREPGMAPQAITFAGHAAFRADDNFYSTPVSVAVAPVSPLTIHLTEHVPVGCTFSHWNVVVPGVANSTLVGGSGSDTGVFTAEVGYTDELPLSLRVVARCHLASSFAARRISPTTTNFDVEVPAEPILTAPASGTKVTAATLFSWTAPASALAVVHLADIDANGFTLGTLDVMTTDTSFTFPDLTALSAEVVPGKAPTWLVDAWGPVTSTDAASDPSGFGKFLAGTGDFFHGGLGALITPSP